MKKKLILLISIFVIVISINSAKALDYPGSGSELTAVVPADGLTLIHNGEEITVRNGESENLDDYEGSAGYTQGIIKINVIVPSGVTLSAGDYFNIVITSGKAGTKVDMSFTSLDWTDLVDNTNTVIGQWRIKDNNIQVIFNENVNGKSSISQLQLVTGTKGVRSSTTTYDRIGSAYFGEQLFTFRIDGEALAKISNDTKWQSSGTSNYNIYWAVRMGTRLTRDLWNSRGSDGDFSDAILEDSFPGADSVTFSVSKSLYVPASLTEDGISEKVFRNFGITSSFRKINQIQGESYEDFKARVIASPLQYGFYKDSEQTLHIIVYCGKLGVDTPLYTQNNIETIVDDFIVNEIYEESDRETLIEEFQKAYLNGKTGGHSTAIRIYMRAYYPKTNVDRTISNTAYVSYDGVVSQLKRNGTLSATSGTGEITSARVTITKRDENTNALLQGARIKLQFRDGDEWVDYTNPTTGKVEHETNENGVVIFENLPIGNFRAVEVKPPKGYDGEEISESFSVVSGSDLDKQIEMLNTKHNYQIITHHYKEGTTEKLGEDVTQNKYYGDSYGTNPLTNIPEGYELIGTPGNANGTVGEADIIVNYYYKLKDVILTVKHLDKDSEETLTNDEVIHYSYGDSYTTEESTNIPDNYEFLETLGDVSGTIKENKTVIYYYKKKADPIGPLGKITVKYVDIEGNEIAESIVSTKEIGNSYTSSAKEIEGYVLKESPGTEDYTYTEEEQVVIYVYEKIKVKVETKADTGGSIEGDEEVYYGDNSTVNKIKIIADPGYVIYKVFINGEEIEIPSNSETLVLSNFINLRENKKIEVEFQKKEVNKINNSPKTNTNYILVIIGVIVTMIVGYYCIKNYLPRYNKKI